MVRMDCMQGFANKKIRFVFQNPKLLGIISWNGTPENIQHAMLIYGVDCSSRGKEADLRSYWPIFIFCVGVEEYLYFVNNPKSDN